ncbi:hypothetical protein, variant [Capsaspora owczarzaki ATCC 30864]|uniref:UDENN domain-containing protein n=1 Tax=Capsaspora owczarzaki (strain ATCC 30864) TaxID=595528 RepID=A0A0D2X1S0_CAPO3|nr:hypothetical protein, variant [Capsaspora owczarzaki ATCC 30864]
MFVLQWLRQERCQHSRREEHQAARLLTAHRGAGVKTTTPAAAISGVPRSQTTSVAARLTAKPMSQPTVLPALPPSRTTGRRFTSAVDHINDADPAGHGGSRKQLISGGNTSFKPRSKTIDSTPTPSSTSSPVSNSTPVNGTSANGTPVNGTPYSNTTPAESPVTTPSWANNAPSATQIFTAALSSPQAQLPTQTAISSPQSASAINAEAIHPPARRVPSAPVQTSVASKGAAPSKPLPGLISGGDPSTRRPHVAFSTEPSSANGASVKPAAAAANDAIVSSGLSRVETDNIYRPRTRTFSASDNKQESSSHGDSETVIAPPPRSYRQRAMTAESAPAPPAWVMNSANSAESVFDEDLKGHDSPSSRKVAFAVPSTNPSAPPRPLAKSFSVVPQSAPVVPPALPPKPKIMQRSASAAAEDLLSVSDDSAEASPTKVSTSGFSLDQQAAALRRAKADSQSQASSRSASFRSLPPGASLNRPPAPPPQDSSHGISLPQNLRTSQLPVAKPQPAPRRPPPAMLPSRPKRPLPVPGTAPPSHPLPPAPTAAPSNLPQPVSAAHQPLANPPAQATFHPSSHPSSPPSTNGLHAPRSRVQQYAGDQLFDFAVVVALQPASGSDSSSSNRCGLVAKIARHIPDDLDELTRSQIGAVPQFCFPDVEEWDYRSSYASETFSFVLTDGEGHKRFAYCRRLLPPGNGPRLAEVYCLISPIGCFSLFEAILNVVDERRRVSLHAVDAFLRVVSTAAFPQPGQALVITTDNVTGDGEEEFTLCPPGDLARLEQVHYTPLFDALGITGVLQVFAALTLERRVLFCASSLTTLSACVHAATALLYPFSWQNVYIPVLPHALLDFVCSPMPFVIGILSSCKPLLQTMPMESEVLIVDLDSGKFLAQVGDETQLLPANQLVLLKRHLVSALSTGIKGSPSNAQERDQMIGSAFLRFFVDVLRSYRRCLRKKADTFIFDKRTFLSTAPRTDVPFLTRFLESQMFDVFIAEREDTISALALSDGVFEKRLSQIDGADSIFDEHIKQMQSVARAPLSDVRGRLQTLTSRVSVRRK